MNQYRLIYPFWSDISSEALYLGILRLELHNVLHVLPKARFCLFLGEYLPFWLHILDSICPLLVNKRNAAKQQNLNVRSSTC
jgi:hypothetical protein